MDCVDCHNRASHNFRRPAEVIDESLTQGVLPNLPYIKDQGVKVLEKQYATEEEAAAAIAAIEDYYKNEQPEVYAQREADVKTAVTVLQDDLRPDAVPLHERDLGEPPQQHRPQGLPGLLPLSRRQAPEPGQPGDPARVQHLPHHPAAGRAGPDAARRSRRSRRPTSPTRTSPPPGWRSTATSSTPPAPRATRSSNPGGSDNIELLLEQRVPWHRVEVRRPERAGDPASCRSLPRSRRPARRTRSRIRSCERRTARSATDLTRSCPYPANHASFSTDICTGCHTPSVPPGARRTDADDAAHDPAPTRRHG